MTRPLLLKKRSKFGAIKSEYGGQVYDSKREAAHAYSLDMLKAAGEILSWERQIRVPLEVDGLLLATYVVDFHVHYADGRAEWHEVKGTDTPLGLHKMKHFLAQYPQRTLKVIR